jgi:hypothetical protein
MAQTTHAGSSEDARIAYDRTDLGTTWVDMSGWAVTATFDSWDRATGQVNTLDGDEAIAGFGKLNLTGMTVTAVYSDGDTTDLVEQVAAAHVVAGGGQFMVQYCPQGTGATKLCIETETDAKIDSFTFPDFDAGDGTPLAFSFHVTTKGFNYAAHG